MSLLCVPFRPKCGFWLKKKISKAFYDPWETKGLRWSTCIGLITMFAARRGVPIDAWYGANRRALLQFMANIADELGYGYRSNVLIRPQRQTRMVAMHAARAHTQTHWLYRTMICKRWSHLPSDNFGKQTSDSISI